VHEATIAAGAYPSPYNYFSFPRSVCTSINEVICHGIPDRRPLVEGDIINVDVSVYYKGYHGAWVRGWVGGWVGGWAGGRAGGRVGGCAGQGVKDVLWGSLVCGWCAGWGG
jgi:hypothetical protein